MRRALTPTERADDVAPDPLFSEDGEGVGVVDVDLEELEELKELEELEVVLGSVIVDGPRGELEEEPGGMKVADGPPVSVFVFVFVFVFVLVRVDGLPEDGGLQLGVLEESR